MSAVAPLDRAEPISGPAVTQAGAQSVTPSEDDLLDVLYEVLAQGVPPRSSLSREEVERFLHEHARERKSLAEMIRFFERHGLPTHASLYGADHALRELASGLQKEHGSLAPGFLAAEQAPPPVASATDTGAVAALVVPSENTGRHARRPSSTNVYLMGLTLLVAGVLLSGFIFSFERSSSLEQRLEHARMQQRSTDAALTKLEQRSEGLKEALLASEQERRAITAKFEAILAEERTKRASEEQALEKVLGARYRTLREKLTSEAIVSRP
jgi:hypothetical protein